MSEQVPKKVHEMLKKKYKCYVLVACNEAEEDGSMSVEMTYEGADPCLISYLLEGAQEKLLEQFEYPSNPSKEPSTRTKSC